LSKLRDERSNRHRLSDAEAESALSFAAKGLVGFLCYLAAHFGSDGAGQFVLSDGQSIISLSGNDVGKIAHRRRHNKQKIMRNCRMNVTELLAAITGFVAIGRLST
jgi:hypothetical protein